MVYVHPDKDMRDKIRYFDKQTERDYGVTKLIVSKIIQNFIPS